MRNDVKTKVKDFLREYDLNVVTLSALRKVLQEQGYTIIEFNQVYNEEDVATLIKALGIEQNIKSSKGFTYADQNSRLVFVNEDLSDKEKLLVLAHEEGHIYCNHFSTAAIIGRDVVEEHEAGEFAHYLLNPDKHRTGKEWIKQNKKLASGIAAVVVVIVAAGVIWGVQLKGKQYYGDYYLTATGFKYHRKECVFIKGKENVHRMTKEEFDSGDYEACGMCLPGKEVEEPASSE